MRKLLPDLKLLLRRNPRQPTCAAALTSPPPANPPRSAPLTDLDSLIRIFSNTSRSWLPAAAHAAPSHNSTSLGLLAHRLLSTRSRLREFRGFIESGARSLNVSLRRQPQFHFGRFSGRRGGFWDFLNLTPDGAIWGLIGVNLAVFFLWRMGDPRFMRNHFMISVDNVKAGRLHTVLTSAFSHVEVEHLAANMIGLYFFGMNIANIFGPQFLLNLYLGGAVAGSAFFLLHKIFIARPSKGVSGFDYSSIPGLGASAAVNSIILLQVFLFPKHIYYVNFFIPVPGILLGAFIVGSDLWRVRKGEGEISGSAHLGGALVAALVWARIKGWY